MRRIVACIIVVLLTFVAPPASAQFGNAGWGTDFVEVRESDGEVVLTLSFGGTGNVKYTTVDASARSPKDYTAVSGEVVFASPGSRTIRIPIVNDELAEGGSEDFRVHAVEDPNPDPWPHKGSVVTVQINDDDETGTSAETADGRGSADGGEPAVSGESAATGATTTNDAASERPPSPTARPAASSADGTGDPVSPPTAVSPPSDLEGELVSEGLRPGPGFELLSEGPRELGPTRGGGGGASFFWLATASGIATLGLGALAILQRRRRWSPTQP